MNDLHLAVRLLFVLCLSPAVALGASSPVAAMDRSPAPNPPHVGFSGPLEGRASGGEALSGLAAVEWTFHKTNDGAHPDGNEQMMMWLMNRARANPPAEGVWLATSTDPAIASGRTYFGVDLDVLQNEFAGYAPKPPAAFDVRLYNAAEAHSLDLIARDAQDHTGQFQRVTDAGFDYRSARGNVFSYTQNALNGHAALNIDWGPGTSDGMQTGRAHRKAIMSLDGDYTNVGIALVPDTDPDTQVGPLVLTGNYCNADPTAADHYNTFIVGTVWQDADGDGMYDPGEGFGGVQVEPDSGDYYAVTALSGGYAIPILSAGSYEVTFSGPVSAVRTVDVGTDSVLLDLEVVDYPLPDRIGGFILVKSGDSVGFYWTFDPAAGGGYNLYQTDLPSEIPDLRLDTPGVVPFLHAEASELLPFDYPQGVIVGETYYQIVGVNPNGAEGSN